MVDGTTDKNRKEIQSLVCRFLVNNKTEEHCRSIKGVYDHFAKGIRYQRIYLRRVQNFRKWPCSQSYDGASVMTGDYNGPQRLINYVFHTYMVSCIKLIL